MSKNNKMINGLAAFSEFYMNWCKKCIFEKQLLNSSKAINILLPAKLLLYVCV